MNILKRKKKIQDEVPGLMLSLNGGEIQINFKNEIIQGLRQLVTRVQQNGGFPERLSVVSALRKEGVSYISQALATTMAHDLDCQICLVDLNIWWPDDFFQTSLEQPSLLQILTEDIQLEQVLLPTDYPNLKILRSGEIPRQKRPVLAKSKELADFIDNLNIHFDYVILDIPAILATTDSVTLASLGNVACLVIQQGVTQVGDVSQALDEIEHLEMMGSVLNNIRIATPKPILKVLSIW
jgi:Mrp family chromosome partitioning ATPase